VLKCLQDICNLDQNSENKLKYDLYIDSRLEEIQNEKLLKLRSKKKKFKDTVNFNMLQPSQGDKINCPLQFITFSINNKSISGMIDTGASSSLIAQSIVTEINPPKRHLRSAKYSLLCALGTVPNAIS